MKVQLKELLDKGRSLDGTVFNKMFKTFVYEYLTSINFIEKIAPYVLRGQSAETKIEFTPDMILVTFEDLNAHDDEDEDQETDISIDKMYKMNSDKSFKISINIKFHNSPTHSWIMRLYTLEVRRQINCCGLAVLTNIGRHYSVPTENIKGLGAVVTSIGEIIAYCSGYNAVSLTKAISPRSTRVLLKMGYKEGLSWENARTRTTLQLMCKEVTKENIIKNLSEIQDYVTAGTKPKDTVTRTDKFQPTA